MKIIKENEDKILTGILAGIVMILIIFIPYYTGMVILIAANASPTIAPAFACWFIGFVALGGLVLAYSIIEFVLIEIYESVRGDAELRQQ